MPMPINYTGQQKIAILREHFVENVPVSGVCKKHGISVVNFYCWQSILFEEEAATLFERKPNASSRPRQEAAAVLFREAIS